MKNIFCILLASIFILSCKKDKEPETPACTGTMTVNQDGTNFTASGFNNTLIKESTNGQAGRRLDIRANVNGGTLVLSVSNYDSQNPPNNGVVVKAYNNDNTGMACQTISGYDYCDGMLGTFIKGTTYMTFDETLPGHITISSIDGSKVSGSYNFQVTPADESDTLTFSGTFTNQCYTVR